MRLSELETLISAAKATLEDIEPSVKAEKLRDAIKAAEAMAKQFRATTKREREYAAKRKAELKRQLEELDDPIIMPNYDDDEM
jgi:hypothetical protein